MERVLTRTVHKRVALAWVVLVIVLSLQPARMRQTYGHTIEHAVMHVVLFGLTGVILLALARNRREQFNAVAGVVCLGIGIEISQYLIYTLPGFEWWDVRDDVIGAVIALVIHQVWPIPVCE